MSNKVKYDKGAKNEWNLRTSSILAKNVDDIEFAPIFEKYLPISKAYDCLEIGAIPGDFLVYMHKRFGYKVHGIDFADNSKAFHDTMKKNKIINYSFVKADFFKFKFPQKYDVVTSYGFIEHFDDINDVLSRHVSLVEKNGYLVITLPNFRFFQHIYHYKYDRRNLEIHNLNTMKLAMLKRRIKNLGMKKIYAGYFGNLKVWREDTPISDHQRRHVNKIHDFVNQHGSSFPNSRFYSPYIILIYRKND